MDRTCQTCLGPILGRVAQARHCSDQCRRKSSVPTHACEGCGATWSNVRGGKRRSWCSSECRAASKWVDRACGDCGTDITGVPWGEPVCTECAATRLKARNQASRPPRKNPCPWCGRVRLTARGLGGRTIGCSKVCGEAIQLWDDFAGLLYSSTRAKPMPPVATQHRCEWCNAGPLPQRRRFCNAWCGERVRGRRVDAAPVWFTECVSCGDLFAGRTQGSKYCSKGCRKARQKWPISPKKRLKVYERDGYRCGICNRLTDPTDFEIVDGHTVTGRRAPSVDHVIPRSMGGPHEMWNLRTAHFGCNSDRGDDPRGIFWWGPLGDEATAWMIANGWIRGDDDASFLSEAGRSAA